MTACAVGCLPKRPPDWPASSHPGTTARRPLRILYLHQHFSTPEGATGTRSFAMARALAARGHAVTLACGRYAGAETGLAGRFRHGRRKGEVGGFRVVEYAIPCGNAQGLTARAGAFLRYAARAGALALGGPGGAGAGDGTIAVAGDGRSRWDLLIASSTPLTVALPALAAERLRGVPFVFEIRDPWPELPRAMRVGSPVVWAALDRLADAACRRAAAVVALSAGMAETALAHGAAPGRLHVVPNGADLELFGPGIAPWRPPEAAPGEVLAVYAGAHGPANGLDQLLDAAAVAPGAPQGGNLRLLLVGQGAEKPRLLARAAGLGNISFLDPLPQPRLAALLAASQIGIHCLAPHPGFAEWTAPNKLMDYLAAGLPVVANQGGTTERLLRDGPCGIAVPPGDPAAFGIALAELAMDPARRAAMGQAARALAVGRHDRRRLAEQFCDIVEAAA